MEAPFLDALVAADEDWADPDAWRAIKVAATSWTPAYLLAAVDFKYEGTGEIVRQDEDRRILAELSQHRG